MSSASVAVALVVPASFSVAAVVASVAVTAEVAAPVVVCNCAVVDEVLDFVVGMFVVVGLSVVGGGPERKRQIN